jgi:cholest-4-en-3-one 26-monooxygenase
MDPPQHTRQRKLVSAGFTPRMVAKLDDQARQWAGQIVDRALEQGECNFVHDIAYQLPMNLIADIVGIPVSDRGRLFDLISKQLYALDPENPLPPEEAAALVGEVFMYGRELSAAKRREPTDDVWSLLTSVEVAQEDGTTTRLSDMELDLFFLVLAVAGSETTRNTMSSGLIALLEHPDQMQRMRTDPSVMNSAVEEILRWSSPVTYFRRTAVNDMVLHDVPIRAGEPVTLWYPSANRDADAFPDPFAFDITRTLNPHVAFGGPGVHHCLGANLARREIRVMFEELLARVGAIEQLGDPVYSVAGIQSPVSLSLKELPVRLTPR